MKIRFLFLLIPIAILSSFAWVNKSAAGDGLRSINTDAKKLAGSVELNEPVVANSGPSLALVRLLLVGEWVGAEGNLVIEEVSEDAVVGYVKATKRALNGNWSEATIDQSCAVAILCELAEPGDEEGDGVYTITFAGYYDQYETDLGVECDYEKIAARDGYGMWKGNKSEGDDFSEVILSYLSE